MLQDSTQLLLLHQRHHRKQLDITLLNVKFINPAT